jgi:hypothetical protein
LEWPEAKKAANQVREWGIEVWTSRTRLAASTDII